MEKEQYLADRLENQIDWYDRKSISNQTAFKRLQILVIVASAAIPLLTGYLDDAPTTFRITIGVLGVLVAVATALLSLYRFQENWIEYRTTCESLRQEKFLYLAGAEPYTTDDPFALLVQRVEGLIAKQNTNWASRQTREQKAGSAEQAHKDEQADKDKT